MEKKNFKKIRHNHSRNLKIVLKELRLGNEQGGVSLEYLAQRCGVSTRQIYRYLNELQNLGYEILKTINQEPDANGGYTIKDSTNEHNEDIPIINMLGGLANIGNEIQSAKYFCNELLLRVWLKNVGIILPLTIPVLSYKVEDAVSVSKQTMVFSDRAEEAWQDIKLKVMAKVYSNFAESFSSEIISKQRQRDGDYIIHLKTQRVKEMTGLLTQWGGAVEVIEPGWLKHKIVENCKELLYANRLKKMEKTNLYSPDNKISLVIK